MILPFEKKAVMNYIDECIIYWRAERKNGDSMAQYYIDAFQSVRTSMFGELLPEEEGETVVYRQGVNHVAV